MSSLSRLVSKKCVKQGRLFKSLNSDLVQKKGILGYLKTRIIENRENLIDNTLLNFHYSVILIQ